MSVNAWLVVLCMILHSCLCSEEKTGCQKWTKNGNEVCCDLCYPGHRMVRACGPKPKDLCTPCDNGTFIVNPTAKKCDRCTHCVGAQVLLEPCTAFSDTKCGCIKGLVCGDDRCSFCVEECPEGFESVNRGCRPCPHGTFNDKINHKCKPWSEKCPKPNQMMVAKGTAVSDIKCAEVSVFPVTSTKAPEQEGSLVLSVIIIAVLMALIITTIVIIIGVKIWNKNPDPKPTEHIQDDDPHTLIAVECSFQEPQQEKGSTCSTESLDSKDSSTQLLNGGA